MVMQLDRLNIFHLPSYKTSCGQFFLKYRVVILWNENVHMHSHWIRRKVDCKNNNDCY